MTTLFGIKNCDTVKKARQWLDDNGIDYFFHDFRVEGLSKKQLDVWIKVVGWETLLNKRSTTFRNLSTHDKTSINNDKAKTLMLKHTTLIKRPVLVTGKETLVGFEPELYQNLFS